MTNVYTLKITYCDCESKIWRIAQVSSNSTLARLGYMVLATFDTLAYHLFSIEYNGALFELPFEDFDCEEDFSLFDVKLSQLELKTGEKLQMIYDFGCDQCFDIEVINIEPMQKGTGRAYPKILAGEGKGILEDVPAFETLEIIKQIDKTGKSDYKYLTRYDNEMIWDYRVFDLESENILLKGFVEQIAEGYEEM